MAHTHTSTYATLAVRASTYFDVRKRFVAIDAQLGRNEYVREYIHNYGHPTDEVIVLGAIGLVIEKENKEHRPSNKNLRKRRMPLVKTKKGWRPLKLDTKAFLES